MKKTKGIGLEGPKEDMMMRARSDMHTMRQAEEIKSDMGRMKMMRQEAQREMDAMAKLVVISRPGTRRGAY